MTTSETILSSRLSLSARARQDLRMGSRFGCSYCFHGPTAKRRSTRTYDLPMVTTRASRPLQIYCKRSPKSFRGDLDRTGGSDLRCAEEGSERCNCGRSRGKRGLGLIRSCAPWPEGSFHDINCRIKARGKPGQCRIQPRNI